MDLEELAFKNITEISELPREILLHIIVILQQDRKCWIEQYTRGHNDFIDVQTRNDKAIEYIEENRDYQDILIGRTQLESGKLFTEDILREKNIEELLEILKGSDK